jgi:hypothetical protein
VSERSGLGLVDLSILRAIEGLGADVRRPHTKGAAVVYHLDPTLGLAPKNAFEALCDMARPWVLGIPLIDFHGYLGTRDLPPASMRLCEVRLTHAGHSALAAEREDHGPVPLGMVNGNMHQGGGSPPFSAYGMLAALRLAVESPSAFNWELTDLVGEPLFPTGCRVHGDFGALNAGEHVELFESAVITTDAETGNVIIEHLPPRSSPQAVADILLGRWQPRDVEEPALSDSEGSIPRLIATVENRSTDLGDYLVCVPRSGVDVDEIRNKLTQIRGLRQRERFQLPASLATMIRGWASRFPGEDLADGLRILEKAIASDQG